MHTRIMIVRYEHKLRKTINAVRIHKSKDQTTIKSEIAYETLEQIDRTCRCA